MSLSHTFTNLHLHTHFGLAGSKTGMELLIASVKADGGKAVAITDHGNMFGVIPFYDAARAAGIKPIIGLEAYVSGGSLGGQEGGDGGSEAYHLLLLAKSAMGYRNLMKLSSIGYLKGSCRPPGIDREMLRELRGGVICTSACLEGEVPQALLRGNLKGAKEIIRWYLDVFGEDYYLELEDHGLREEQLVNAQLRDIARELGVGLIVSNDVHYLEQKDAAAHVVWSRISSCWAMSDAERTRLSSGQFYLKTRDEMQTLFAGCPDALATTERVADLCNVELDLGARPRAICRIPAGKTDKEHLCELACKGAEEKYGELAPEIRGRIDHEIDAIYSRGCCAHFLILSDLVSFARGAGIPCRAQGAGCSSIVSYALGISMTDPVRYGLCFERFMASGNDQGMGIDLEICPKGRERLIAHLEQTYKHVARVINHERPETRTLVTEVSRVLGLGVQETETLAELVSDMLKMTIEKAMAVEPELQKLYGENETVREVIDISKRLEGLPWRLGVHPSMIVVSDQPLVEQVPLFKLADSGPIITQFDSPGVEKTGLLTINLLNLKALEVMERTRQTAEQNHGVAIDLDKIDLADQKVYELFVRGDTEGVFEFESAGMRDVIMKLRPDRIEDLIAAHAMYRPGPMIYIDDYVQRKHGQKWSTKHPFMTEVLNETYGIMVFQEQVAQLVGRVGRIDMGPAFQLAKAISSKKTDFIEEMRKPFIKGATGQGIKKETAEQIFEDILQFGSYAFNRAVAANQALLGFRMAYLKAHYPKEFCAASPRITSEW